MKKTIRAIVRHPLISGSSIIFVGSFIANIFNYFFNLAMGRMLRVEDYGLLSALSSLFILLAVFQSAFGNIFTKFSAPFAVNHDIGAEKALFYKGLKYVFIFSALLLIILLTVTNQLSGFLHVDNKILLVIIFFTIFFNILGSVTGGILNGHMKFFVLSIFGVISPVIKLVVGISLVIAGWQIFGAVTGIFLSSFLGLILSYWYVARWYRGKHEKNIEFEGKFLKDFTHQSYAFLLASVGMTLLSNTDIILVRHYFSGTVSGQYAALSLMGKAIFYFTTPINSVFFPVIAQKHEKKERLFGTVMFATAIISLLSLSLSFVYFVFPNVILRIFFPLPEYRVLTGYLGIFSLYIFMFSLVTLFINFFLSIGRTEIYKLMIVAAIVQIGLIAFIHGSLYQVIGVMFAVNATLMACFLVYYVTNGKD